MIDYTAFDPEPADEMPVEELSFDRYDPFPDVVERDDSDGTVVADDYGAARPS